jgi:hypothetical protein
MIMDTKVQTAQRSLRSQGLGMLFSLTLQYILGMVSNLYVQFPNTTVEGQLWEFAWTQVSEAAHIILGLLLFIASLVLLIRAVSSKQRTWTIAGSIGLAGILVAIYGGVRFIPTQNAPYSLLMSIAFIIAMLAYVWGLFKSKN